MDQDTIGQIISIIEEQGISEITFVLSEDNPIILDALSRQNFSTIVGMENAYNDVKEHSKAVQRNWNKHDKHVMMLSYYLNQKIEEFRHIVGPRLSAAPCIQGKLYSASYDAFREIYSPLLCMDTTMSN